MDGINKMNTSPAAPLSPVNRVAKGPLDRFLFRGKPPVVEKPAIPKLPEPEVVIVPDTTDCIDISSGSSANENNNKISLQQHVIEETLAENEESDAQDGFAITDSQSEDIEDDRESSKSGKHSALGVQTTAESAANTSLTHSAQKKRRRLSLDEQKAREAEMERKKAEREKRHEEKERKKVELENAKKERLEARQRKIESMKEAERQREEKRKQAEAEKEEKKKQAEAEKEEKRKQAEAEKEEKRKQAELEREEKRKQAEREKEEKRKAKEAEKQSLEEAKKRRMEGEQMKISKAAEMFKRHFFVVQGTNKDSAKDSESADTSYKSFGPFKMFQLRPNQRLAAICRLSRDDRDLAKSQLDKFLAEHAGAVDLLKEYRAGLRKFRSSGPTYPIPENDVIQLDENRTNSIMRAKLLQFTEDIRPPYFGTWRKRSKLVSARKPFAQDTANFDYECDSAADWEEPEDGEDIGSSSKESGDEDTDAPKSSDEEDDGFIVPHGYLSTDEEEAREEEEQQNLPPSDVKMKNRIQDSYELGFKKLAKSLRPVFFGPELVDSGRPLPVDLSQFQPFFYDPIPVDVEAILCGEVVVPDPELAKEAVVVEKSDQAVASIEGSAVKKSKLSKDGEGTPGMKVHKKPVPEEGYPALIRYIHGNSAGIGRLVEGFVASFTHEPEVGCEVSKRQVERQIFAIAERMVKTDRFPSACWYVRDDVLAKYNLTDLPVPNTTATMAPKRPRKQLKLPGAGEADGAGSSQVIKPAPLTPTVVTTQPKLPFEVITKVSANN